MPRNPLPRARLALGVGILLLACVPAARGQCLSLDTLARMSWEELEALYRASDPGPIPVGYARGRAIDRVPGVRTRLANLAWRGKHFPARGEVLVNQWLGFRAVRARVGTAPSWLDGRPSIVLDYAGTSPLVWKDVRDEIRAVAPGLYLGIMYRRDCPCPRKERFFALQFCP